MNKYRVKLKSQILANKLCGKVNLPHIEIRFAEHNPNYKGEYFYESGFIRIYFNDATEQQIQDTLIHELAHHYQYINNKNLKHNKRFYDTITLLKLAMNF